MTLAPGLTDRVTLPLGKKLSTFCPKFIGILSTFKVPTLCQTIKAKYAGGVACVCLALIVFTFQSCNCPSWKKCFQQSILTGTLWKAVLTSVQPSSCLASLDSVALLTLKLTTDLHVWLNPNQYNKRSAKQ